MAITQSPSLLSLSLSRPPRACASASGPHGAHAALLALKAVHEVLRLYVNFFQPVRKLVSKERHSARVLKRYDRAQTPYRRLLASGVLTPARRDALVAEYHRLNPLQLRAELAVRLDALWKLADRSERSAA